MSEVLTIYEVGDRFATITAEGKATVWEVDVEGIPVEAPFPTNQPQEQPMTEPDHRAQAEYWLSHATASIDEGSEGFAQAEALIGIGHALLAEQQPVTINAPNYIPSEDPSLEFRCDFAQGNNHCVRYADHSGPHHMAWVQSDQPQEPADA